MYVLRYLQGTKSYRLRYDGASNDGLVAYSDSDWAEDHDDRHSTSGMVFMLASGAISWGSRRQPTVSVSSTEAEYKAAAGACRQMTWLRTFSDELGYDMNFATPLFVDNQGAIFLSVNPVVERRTCTSRSGTTTSASTTKLDMWTSSTLLRTTCSQTLSPRTCHLLKWLSSVMVSVFVDLQLDSSQCGLSGSVEHRTSGSTPDRTYGAYCASPLPYADSCTILLTEGSGTS